MYNVATHYIHTHLSGGTGLVKLCWCLQVVKMVMERQLKPVIVFSFSRQNCEALALDMSKLDFNTRELYTVAGMQYW